MRTPSFAAAALIAAVACAAPTAHADPLKAKDTAGLMESMRAKAAANPQLGRPIAAEQVSTAFGALGAYQRFAQGTVAATDAGAYLITSGLQTTWTPEADGWPAQDTTALPTISGSRGAAAYFTKPSLGLRSNGAGYAKAGHVGYFVSGDMFATFAARGGLFGLGWPVGPAVAVPRCASTTQAFSVAGVVPVDQRWCPPAGYAAPYLTQAGNGVGNVQRRGYNGTAVYLMQRALRVSSSKPYGSVWDARFQEALGAFLRTKGRPATTSVGAATWNLLDTGYPFNVSTWTAPLMADVTKTRAQHIAASIAWARTQLGTRYLWGATGNAGPSLGYDCAGFVLQALRAGGANLTRVSNWMDQYPPSDLSNHLFHDSELQVAGTLKTLQVGDLIFYGTSHGGVQRARHVALYIGNGMTIQAVPSGVRLVPVYSGGKPTTGGWPYVLGVRRPFATATVAGRARSALAVSTPLAMVAAPADTTLWGLNSWAVPLPQRTGTPIDRSGWWAVTPGQRVRIGGGGQRTAVLAGHGVAVEVRPDASGDLVVPAGVQALLLVSAPDALSVVPGSPVEMVPAD